MCTQSAMFSFQAVLSVAFARSQYLKIEGKVITGIGPASFWTWLHAKKYIKNCSVLMQVEQGSPYDSMCHH